MRPGNDLWARKWVREFWIDQMRRENAPDLPETVSVEQFNRESRALADKLQGKDRP